MSTSGYISNNDLKKLYKLPHYYYRVFSDDTEVFGTLDKSLAEKKFKETKGNYVELVRYNHGNYDKIIKSKEVE